MVHRDDDSPRPTPPPSGPALARRVMIFAALGAAACGDNKDGNSDSAATAVPMTPASTGSDSDSTTDAPTGGQSSEPPMPGPGSDTDVSSTVAPMIPPDTSTGATTTTTTDSDGTTAIPPMPPPDTSTGEPDSTTAIPPMPDPSGGP